MSSDNTRLRLSIVGIVVVSLFSTLFARLWYLQVMDTGTFQALATQNRVRTVYDPAPRGRILDRQGRPLVENRGYQAITVIRHEVAGKPEVVARLAALLGVSQTELQRRIDDRRYSPYKPVPVAENVPEETVVYLRENSLAFPGVEAQTVAERTYPHGSLAAHVLGYVGEINDAELSARQGKGYRLGDDIGKSGVEQSFEDDLRGTPGATRLEVDAAGNVLLPALSTTPPKPGHDIQLTIDLDVQGLAEDSLQKGLEAARGQRDRTTGRGFEAPAGAVIVMDPRDGSLLAMASNPTYNPADFVNGIKPDLFAALQDPNNHYPLTNRAIGGQYAPGSTFKLFTALAALRTGIIAPNTTFLDEGAYTVRGCKNNKCTFRNAGGHAYGRVNLPQALTVSSDAFFYNLGATLWLGGGPNRQAIQGAARDLGLGERTGIALAGEQKGRVSDPDTRKKAHEQNPKAYPNGTWYAGDNVNLAIGQGDTAVTPLQLADAYAAFANGGTIVRPRVVARVLGSDGQSVHDFAPEGVRKVAIDPGQRSAILQGLKGAIANPEGTGAGAFAGFPLLNFPVAGKTGTAQVVGKQDTAVFVAFAPADNPQYVVAVVMEQAGFGGAVAAPVARRILDGLAGAPPGPVQLAGGTD
ncbi:MAG TPA: penicillin-binding protein 2 [Acidimicrobiales bacterium]|nr:penicillin-binding protein 2 [Acidimicrobiales bacterium]